MTGFLLHPISVRVSLYRWILFTCIKCILFLVLCLEVIHFSVAGSFVGLRINSYFVFHLFLFLLISKRAHWAVFPQGKLALLAWGWTHWMAFVKNLSSLMSWRGRGEGECLWWGEVGADETGRRDSQPPWWSVPTSLLTWPSWPFLPLGNMFFTWLPNSSFSLPC